MTAKKPELFNPALTKEQRGEYGLTIALMLAVFLCLGSWLGCVLGIAATWTAMR